MNENNAYLLSFEKYFTNQADAADMTALDYEQATEKGEKHNGPSFVDETRKDLSNLDVVCYKKETAGVENGFYAFKGTKDGEKLAGAHAHLESRKFGNEYLEIKATLREIMPGITPKISLKDESRNCLFPIEFVQVFGMKGKNECAMKAWFLNEGKYRPIQLIYSNNNTWPTLYPPFKSNEHLSGGWHTFGFEKTNEFAVFYVDRNEYCRIDLDCPVFKVFSHDTALDFTLNVGLRQTEAIN